MRGVSVGILIPQSGQAYFSLKSISSPLAKTTRTSPSARLAAISRESRNLFLTPSFNTKRSTTRSISWRLFFSRIISSARSLISPSIRARANPSFWSFFNSFWNSPFFPRTSGAIMLKDAFAGSERMLSRILSIVCDLISRPQRQQ